jgi:signal peptidase I
MSEEKDPVQSEQISDELPATPAPLSPAPAEELAPWPDDNGQTAEPRADKVRPAEHRPSPQPAPPKRGWLAILLGQPAPQPASASAPQPKHHDIIREVAETVVFVVVLVLLLKTFIAEAFVIPTGSMATTLWGYQKVVECTECGFTFPVNCSSQVDPQNPTDHANVMGCTCPNCRYTIHFKSKDDPSWNSGDRVLVAKFLYDSGLRKPQRYDVVVFKYPGKLEARGDGWEIGDGPQKNQVAINYIKRLIGMPGETIGIHGGRLYVAEGYTYDDSKVPADLLRRFTHSPDDRDDTQENRAKSAQVLQDFKNDMVLPANDPKRKFHILRKPPEVLLALSRPVYDNDFQARDQTVTRWYVPEKGWTADNASFPKHFSAEAAGSTVNWLRYRNVLRESDKPVPITDFMGYNAGITNSGISKSGGDRWVGDLIIDAEYKLDTAAPGDELWLELRRGVDRFQARFNLENGSCTLVRLTKPDNQEQVLAQKDTPLKGPGTYKIRFANVDERLTLWVNDQMPFGDGQVYDPPKTLVYDADNDLNPVGIAVKGAPKLSVAHLKLSRDTYYTTSVTAGEDYNILYVQPDHYLCLGDNSPESSDGRVWGLVPNRLLLGRALMVYFPFKPFGNENRVGPIK